MVWLNRFHVCNHLVINMLRKVDEHISLVGTAHISEKSAREVERAILEIRPDIVAVELDRERYLALTRRKKWERTSIFKVLRSGKATLMLVQIFLGTIQKKLGKKTNVRPGAEMISAIRTARKNNIPIALVDRDIAVTFKRGWKGMGFVEKWRLLWYGMMAIFGGDEEEFEEAEIEEMLKDDVITVMIRELKEIAPGIGKVFIDERDSFIALKLIALRGGEEKPMKQTGKKLRVLKGRKNDIHSDTLMSVAREERSDIEEPSKSIRKKKVLGILGAGHLDGVSRRIKDPKNIGSMDELNHVKKKRFSVGRAFGFAVPVMFACLVAYLIIEGDYSKLGDVVLWWFLINGICSALGAILARGHFLSIITAFFAAPLTSLNPLLAAGWFAGIVEANVRKPTVADMEKLGSYDRLRDFFNNRLVRVLMVAALANLGSVLGTYIAAAKIVELVT